MTFLPIVERELRVAARRKGTYRIRRWTTIIAIAFSAFYLLFLWVLTTRGGRGEALFTALTGYAYALCVLAGVLITADSLSEEKREGTLGLLFLTDLKGYDVVLGKFMAMSLNAVYGLLAIFPVISLAILLGGVTGTEFWRMTLALANALFFSLAVGTTVSAWNRDPQWSMGAALALLLCAMVLLPGLEFLRASGNAFHEAWLYVTWFSPFYAFEHARAAAFAARPEKYWIPLLLSHFIGWGCLAAASLALPRLWQDSFAERKSPGTFARLVQWSRGVAGGGAAARARMLRLNPIMWLAMGRREWEWIVWLVVAVWGAVVLALTLSMPDAAVMMVVYYGAKIAGFILKLLVAFQVCRFFVEARRSGALELLLCTPLTSRDIIRGQWLALQNVFLWPLFTFFCIALVPVVVVFCSVPMAASLNPVWAGMTGLGVLGYYLINMLADIVALGWVGMWLAVSMKRPGLATGLTILLVLAFPTVLFCVPDALIAVGFIAWGSVKLQTDLRQYAAAPEQPMAGSAPPGVPPVIGLECRPVLKR